jgi:hypothetical protein
MDHDRLFKQLLTTFFLDFIGLFLPEVSLYLNREGLEFMDKEVFTDVTGGDRHEVDLLVKAKFRETDAFFLIHVENQATPREEFAKRMFRYFARLHEKFDLPVYPIALFSYDAPQRPEPDRYQVLFPDKTVLDFSFCTIQLNRLNWRDFIRRPNPIAAALMAKMKIAPEDRPKVTLELLRIVATLRLDPARTRLLKEFAGSYLILTPRERIEYNSELERLDPAEKRAIVQVVDMWEQSGIAKGVRQSVLRLLERRFGPVPKELKQRLELLDDPVLDEFLLAVLDFHSLADADVWLASRQAGK